MKKSRLNLNANCNRPTRDFVLSCDPALVSYYERWAADVYYVVYKRDQRKFQTILEFVYWALKTLERPGIKYHLMLTGDYDCPCRWVKVEGTECFKWLQQDK